MKSAKKIITLAVCSILATTSMAGINSNAAEPKTPLSAETALAENVSTFTIHNYYNYEEKQIGESCWASCIVSVLAYQNSVSGIELEDVYTKTNQLCGGSLSIGDGAPPAVFTFMVNYYLGMTAKNGALTDTQLKNHLMNINNSPWYDGEPVIGVYTTGTSSSGDPLYHAVVIYGYKIQNGTIISYYVMDPTDGKCKEISKNSKNWIQTYYYSNLT